MLLENCNDQGGRNFFGISQYFFYSRCRYPTVATECFVNDFYLVFHDIFLVNFHWYTKIILWK